MMLIGVLLVPIFGVMSGFAPGRLENFFAFWAALTCNHLFCRRTVGMLFAAIFEEGAPKYQFPMAPTYKCCPFLRQIVRPFSSSVSQPCVTMAAKTTDRGNSSAIPA